MNGFFFEILRFYITDLHQRRSMGRFQNARGPDISKSIDSFWPKGAKLKDFGFDMRPVKRPGIIAWAGLPSARARWNSNVGVFQSLIARLESHNVQLSAPPLTPQRFTEMTAAEQAKANMNPPLVCTLYDVLRIVHVIIDRACPLEKVGAGAWGENGQPFMNNDNVTQLLVAEELATHLLGCQLGTPYQVDQLPNTEGTGRVTPWQHLLTARLIVRLARRSTCHCGQRGGNEVFGEFAALHIIGQDHQFLRDTIEWHDEVKKHTRGRTWENDAPIIDTLDPRCWFNQLAMFHYPDEDYFETGFMIRRWLRGDMQRRLREVNQPCLCPRAASVDMRQENLPQLPDTLMQLATEADWGEELLAKTLVYPHGWELKRDRLSQWEAP